MKSLIIQIILGGLFLEFINRLTAGDFPKIVRYPALILITLVYVVAIVGLAYYGLFAVEKGLMRRVIAGICTLFLTMFIYQLLRKSIKNS